MQRTRTHVDPVTGRTFTVTSPARTIEHMLKENDFGSLVAYVNARWFNVRVLAGVLGVLRKPVWTLCGPFKRDAAFKAHLLARPFTHENWPERIAQAEAFLP